LQDLKFHFFIATALLFSDESVARSMTKSPELQKLSEEDSNNTTKSLDNGLLLKLPFCLRSLHYLLRSFLDS